MMLQDLVLHSAQRYATEIAVVAPNGSLTYKELDRQADQLAHRLWDRKVRVGDRVGIYLLKSTDAIVAMQGILRLGAIYVPLDPLSPVDRVTKIINDCSMKLVITSPELAKLLFQKNIDISFTLTQEQSDSSVADSTGSTSLALPSKTKRRSSPEINEEDIAYILYTSGSTGIPKGVCITHKNALTFITWAAKTLHITSKDRLSNHAGFYFDLSVFDLYVAFLTGATVILIPEKSSFSPVHLAQFLREHKITVWYSVPTVLILMLEQGELGNYDYPELHTVIFAGEVFPINKLKALKSQWPQKHFFNFYGPTETNVCAAYEVKEIAPEWKVSVPIGSICSGNKGWVEKENHQRAHVGEEGELIIQGPTVMKGYWGSSWEHSDVYRSGDIVKILAEEVYLYIGRLDHMVKIKGNRIELGEIEAALSKMPSVKEALVYTEGESSEIKILACLRTNGTNPTLLEIKRHCFKILPKYMIPDKVRFLASVPRTANGKIDRPKVREEIGIF